MGLIWEPPRKGNIKNSELGVRQWVGISAIEFKCYCVGVDKLKNPIHLPYRIFPRKKLTVNCFALSKSLKAAFVFVV